VYGCVDSPEAPEEETECFSTTTWPAVSHEFGYTSERPLDEGGRTCATEKVDAEGDGKEHCPRFARMIGIEKPLVSQTERTLLINHSIPLRQ
jgi:hypothetical protein